MSTNTNNASNETSATATAATSTNDAGGALQTFLDRAGLDAAHMDGTSLKALQDLLVVAAAAPAANTANGNVIVDPQYISSGGGGSNAQNRSDDAAISSLYSCEDYKPRAVGVVASLSQRTGGDPPARDNDNDSDNDSINNASKNAVVTFVTPPDRNDRTAFEHYVVQQLEYQNRMLVNLLRRLDEQQHQQQQQQYEPQQRPNGASLARHATSNGGILHHPDQTWTSPLPPPPPIVGETPAVAAPGDTGVPAQPVVDGPHGVLFQHVDHPPPPPQHTAAAWHAWWTNAWQQFSSETRSGRIVTLYWRLGRVHFRALNNNQQQPPWDPFLIFKVMFMLAILSTKLRRRYQGDGGDWTTKYYTTALVMLLAFLVQTGVMSYTYQFWFQCDYARRIWAGEALSWDQVLTEEMEWLAHPQQQQQQQRRRAAGGGGGWRETFLLGGRVAGIGENNNNNINDPAPPAWMTRIFVLLQDIFFLFGSFVLSIFPMWRAEPRRVAVAPAPENGVAAAAAALPADPVGGGPGVVNPPVDPTGPAEDDDDEEHDDRDEANNANVPPPARD